MITTSRDLQHRHSRWVLEDFYGTTGCYVCQQSLLPFPSLFLIAIYLCLLSLPPCQSLPLPLGLPQCLSLSPYHKFYISLSTYVVLCMSCFELLYFCNMRKFVFVGFDYDCLSTHTTRCFSSTDWDTIMADNENQSFSELQSSLHSDSKKLSILIQEMYDYCLYHGKLLLTSYGM